MADDTGDQDETGSPDMDSVEARLDAALDRIARRLDIPAPAVDTGKLAERLDGLIARVRETLDRGPRD